MWTAVIIAVGIAGGIELGMMVEQVARRRPHRGGGWVFLTAMLGIALLALAAEAFPVG